MSARTELVTRLAELVGHTLVVEEVRDGWPTLATVYTPTSKVPVALFVSKVGLSHRRRDDVERRFQNPAGNKPLVEVPGRASVLLGVWEEDSLLPLPSPLLVTADATRRADGRTTRWSVFAPLPTLQEGLDTGWATHLSDSGELLRCIHPALLPIAVAADVAEAEPQQALVRTALDASGLLEDSFYSASSPAAERARRSTSTLVRDARFSRRVLDAYGGCCAVCGLGLGLVQGAHIYPASAPGSHDEPWNGLALCGNHHLAFDRHVMAVRTSDMGVVFHPEVLAAATQNSAVQDWVSAAETALRTPPPPAGPDPAMFAKRYEFYGDRYHWL